MDRKIQYCQYNSFQLNLQIHCNPSKNSSRYFVDVDKLILKLIWRGKRSRIPITGLKEKDKVGQPPLPTFRTNSEATGVRTGWYRERTGKSMGQNRESVQKQIHTKTVN